ncbi:MAG: hypothetical protein QM501_14715 [Gimesia sp.]
MRNRWYIRFSLSLFGMLLIMASPKTHAHSADSLEKTERIVIVIGATGQEQYEQQFAIWSEHWKIIAKHKQAELTVIGETVDARLTDRERLKRELQRHSDQTSATWLILIGHGTFDGKTARFNLRGPDLTAEQLSKSCEGIKHPLAVINCFSASGAFLKPLSAENRVVITATQNGHEFYFSHFGNFLSQSHSRQQADLDHDGQISLLEGYLTACRETNAYYLKKGQLSTEHALLDDNGDQNGSRMEQFQGLRRIPASHFTIDRLSDGHRAHQFILFSTQPIEQISGEQKQARNELEIEILELKQRKQSFTNLDEYYQNLEPLMIQLSHIYRRVDANKKRTIYDPMVIPVNAKKTSR